MAKESKMKMTFVGIELESKTTNEGGKSAIDCGRLWQEFERGKYFEKIPNKLSDEIMAVYHDYENDHTGQFSYFIGCQVEECAVVADGMKLLIVPEGSFEKVTAKGLMPDCIAEAWKHIWAADLERAYLADFEVYDDRSQDWAKAEVDVFVSVKYLCGIIDEFYNRYHKAAEETGYITL